ncbi:MAG TPA: hypothetical protein VL593_18885 [Ramlibacter sp.]|nr:hypothetical protein [Ramlibacter sp.]
MSSPRANRHGPLARWFPAALAVALVGFGLYFDSLAVQAPFNEQEVAMVGSKARGKAPEAGLAKHGPRSEVTWEGGSGRQPYANQGAQETTESDNREVAEGNRGDESGRNAEQVDKTRGTP